MPQYIPSEMLPYVASDIPLSFQGESPAIWNIPLSFPLNPDSDLSSPVTPLSPVLQISGSTLLTLDPKFLPNLEYHLIILVASYDRFCLPDSI